LNEGETTSKDADSIDGDETRTKRGENTEEAMSALRKDEAFPDYDDGTVKGTIEANAASRRSSKLEASAALPQRVHKKKAKKDSKSKKAMIPSKLYQAMKACNCESCSTLHKDVLKYLKKASVKVVSANSEDGHD
jgi:hypothetical protein